MALRQGSSRPCRRGQQVVGQDGITNSGADKIEATDTSFLGGISNVGVISGAAEQGIYVTNVAQFGSGSAGGITNSGTITGAHTAIFLGGVSFSQAASAIANTGVISGSVAIDVSGAATAVAIDQNGGTVTGSIKLSSHADVLTVSGGAINGNIVGSGSSDTVTFTLGAGNTFTYSSTVSGVNAVSMNTGTVLLEGTLNSSNLAIDGAGTLEVGTGGNIVPSVTDDGALEFGQIGSYTYGGAISGSGMVEQLGAGTTVLTAANNYTGGTAD